MKNIILTTLGLIFMLSSCYKDNEEYLYGEVECDTTAVSFSEDIFPIIQNNCTVTGCHVAGGNAPGTFENFDQVKAKVDDGSFRDRVIVQGDMPPSGSLSDCQKNYITKWLDDGAPNN